MVGEEEKAAPGGLGGLRKEVAFAYGRMHGLLSAREVKLGYFRGRGDITGLAGADKDMKMNR